jgi:hypothetical protein
MTSAADRMRRHREREARGKIVLRIEADEVALIETLAAARLIDRMSDPSRPDLERAVELLLTALAREM